MWQGCTRGRIRLAGEAPTWAKHLVLLEVDMVAGSPTKMMGLARLELGQRKWILGPFCCRNEKNILQEMLESPQITRRESNKLKLVGRVIK